MDCEIYNSWKQLIVVYGNTTSRKECPVEGQGIRQSTTEETDEQNYEGWQIWFLLKTVTGTNFNYFINVDYSYLIMASPNTRRDL